MDNWHRRDILKSGAALGASSFTLTTITTSVRAAPGEQQWAFETGEDILHSSPTVMDGTVFIGSIDYNLYAVDSATGEQEWAFETSYQVTSSPTVVDGTVFVGSDDSNLYAVDSATGEEKWAFQTGGESSPTVADGTVFVGGDNLFAVTAATGDEQWTFETGDDVNSSPTVVEDTVFVGSNDNNLYAVDAATGEQEWTFETGSRVVSSPTVVDGTVFVGSDDNNLYAVDAATGEQEWTFETGATVRSSPTVIDGTVFVGSHDYNLYAVDAATGDQQWRFKTSNPVTLSPTLVDDTVIVGNGRDLYAIEMTDGNERWHRSYYVSSSPTVVDGIVFFGSVDNSLYAVDASVSGSSEGSRVMLGTLGHHGNWRYADQSINAAPTASINVTPTAPRVGESITFDASNPSDPDGAISSYEWSINNATYTGETVEHTFENIGEYSVNLTVTDTDGATNTTTQLLSVGTNQSPTAEFTVSPSSSPETGESVTFDASNSSDPDGAINNYEWSIDSATYTGETVEHTFEDFDQYTVKLTVTDNDGATDTTTQLIHTTVPTEASTETLTPTDSPNRTQTATQTETLANENLRTQQGQNEQLSAQNASNGDSSEIPVLDRFSGSNESLGFGVGLFGILGGGYLVYRRKNDDEQADQQGAKEE